jgi:2-ketoarginine methyltransferase
MLTDDFERRLIENTQPVRFFFLAQALHHALHLGVIAALDGDPGTSSDALADKLGLDRRRTGSLLRYLRNEGYTVLDDGWSLSGRGREVQTFAPWYEMLVGGYAPSMEQLGDVLQDGSIYASRNTTKVGEGSCGIGAYDALPLVERLIEQADATGRPETIVDLGCGDGSFLMDLLVAQPDLHGIGVEPHAGSITLGEKRRAELGLHDRMKLVQGSAQDALAIDLPEGGRGICFMTAFVLQEVMQQEGQQAIEDLLSGAFERYPGARWLVVEMDHQPLAPVMGSHGLALTFYNPYFLLHTTTEQRLETREWWDALFARLGLTAEAVAHPDPRADSTGLQFGVLLSKRP